MGHYIDWHHH